MNIFRTTISRRAILGIVGFPILVLGVVFLFSDWLQPVHPKANEVAAAEGSHSNQGGSGKIRVNSIRARRDRSLEVTVEQPAYVQAYYRADLEARVSGPVKFIQKAGGGEVEKGERLIEI